MKREEGNGLVMSGKKLMGCLTEGRGPPQPARVLCMGRSFTFVVSEHEMECCLCNALGRCGLVMPYM